jgi:AraC-like DNA-binding protein
MIYFDSSSDNLPAADPWDWWCERVRQVVMPVAFQRDRDTDFHFTVRTLKLGAVRLIKQSHSPLRYSRSARLVRQHDPENLHLEFLVRGRHGATVSQRVDVEAAEGGFLLYDTSRAVHGWLSADGNEVAHVLLQVPRALVPLPPNSIDRLVARPLPGRQGIGSLLSGYLSGLLDNASQYQPSDVARLSSVTVDLLTTFLTHHIDTPTPYETQQRILQIRIHTFIQERLGDTRLSPAMIASAHGVSLRYLHRLFHDQGLTPAGWIRQRRLERCCRDLVDPALQSRPIHAIAARWGFTDGAHFSRLFRTTYGMPPSDYRRLAWPE